MKKILLCLVMVIFAFANAMAGSGLTVTSGDKKFFKKMEGTAHLEFIWDNATYDNKQPLTKKFTNLEELKPIAWDGFVEEFNDRSKKVKVVKKNEPAQYKFVMQVKNMDQYFKVTGFIPANATKVWGVLTVWDTKTNKKIAVIDVDEINGGANPSPGGTFSDCFEELGKKMTKLK